MDTQSVPPVRGRFHYKQWYMWLSYLLLGLSLAIAIIFWVDHLIYEAEQEGKFVANCYAAALQVGIEISARHCECAWDELRNHYGVGEIAYWTQGWRDNLQFGDRLMGAMHDCR